MSAPTEMKSTPVSAIARTCRASTPPEASSRHAAGDERDGLAQLGERHVVEQDRVDAGGERLADLVERLALDLDREVGRAAHARRPPR